MRTRRKRPWEAMAVNMTPLIDVVFLNIIFFVVLINFSEIYIRDVNLPGADEARDSLANQNIILPVIIKSDGLIYLDSALAPLDTLTSALKSKKAKMKNFQIQVQADEAVSYKVIKEVLHKLSSAGIGKIEFSALKKSPEPLQEDPNP